MTAAPDNLTEGSDGMDPADPNRAYHLKSEVHAPPAQSESPDNDAPIPAEGSARSDTPRPTPLFSAGRNPSERSDEIPDNLVPFPCDYHPRWNLTVRALFATVIILLAIGLAFDMVVQHV